MSGGVAASERGRSILGALALVLVLAVGGALGARWTRTPDVLSIEPATREAAERARRGAREAGPGETAPVVPALPEVPVLPAGARLSRSHGEGATDEEEGADLSAEMRLLSDARRALRGGEAAVALSLLEQHRERFPAGALAEEREAHAILALRTLGRTAEAERRLADFHAEHPGSALLTRVLSD